MDYILNFIDKKIARFDGTGNVKVYLQLKVEYSFILLLAYFWNKNFEEIGIKDFILQSELIKDIQRPSIGSIATLIQKLDIHKEISKAPKNENSLSDYANLRNDLIGHGYSFEDSLANFTADFEKWWGILFDLRVPVLTRKNNLILCEKFDNETGQFVGIQYTSDGNEIPNWRCAKEVYDFQIGNVYISYEANNYFRLSPFVHLEGSEDALYIFRNVQQQLLGKIRYNRIDKSDNAFTKTWEELQFTATNGVIKKQPNGTVINIFTPNYKRYIEVGSIKKKVEEFLTGKHRGSSVCITLWGHGGNGKTATAQKICEELSLGPVDRRTAFDFIIFLSAKDRELNKYTGRINPISSENRVTSFEDMMQKLNAILYSNESSDTEKFIKETSRCLLVIDDYETFEDNDKQKITDFIEQLNTVYHKVIITTRNSFLKIGKDIPTNELDISDTAKFLLEVLSNEHAYSDRQLATVEQEIKRIEIKRKVHELTLGKPIEIIRFVNCFVQKGRLTDEFLNEMNKVNSNSERIEFLYGRNYSQLKGDPLAQNIFVVIGLLTPPESLTSLVSHIKLILNTKDEEESAFNTALDKLIKLRLIEVDDDGSYKVDSKDILEIMKRQFDKRDHTFQGSAIAIYNRIKTNIGQETDVALLNHVKTLRFQSNAETVIQQYKEIIRQGKDFTYQVKREALLDLSDFLFNQRGLKLEAVKLLDDYFNDYYEFNILKRFANYAWSVDKSKAIQLLEDFYSKYSSRGINMASHEKTHLLSLIVLRESQVLNDKFDWTNRNNAKAKDNYNRIYRAYFHLLFHHVKATNPMRAFTSEELNDITLALDSYADLSYRMYNEELCVQICDYARQTFPDSYAYRFKNKLRRVYGARNAYFPSQPEEEANEGQQVKLKSVDIPVITIDEKETGYKGTIFKTYSDMTNYGYILYETEHILGRIYFRESSLKDLSFKNLSNGDKVIFGFGRINSSKFGAINIAASK